MREQSKRVSIGLLPAVLACALIMDCGSDSVTTGPDSGDESGSGFICEYRRGTYLGINGCVREGDGFAGVYEHEVWCDWWSPGAAGVDSAVFFLSFRITVWPTPVGDCSVRQGLTPLIGERFGDHWRAYSAVGYFMIHPGLGYYSCGEFIPDPVSVRIVYMGGGDTTFTATPTPR